MSKRKNAKVSPELRQNKVNLILHMHSKYFAKHFENISMVYIQYSRKCPPSFFKSWKFIRQLPRNLSVQNYRFKQNLVRPIYENEAI